MRILTDKLRMRLEQSQREGDLPETMAPTVMAEYFASLATGLSVQAAAGATPAQLSQVVEMAMGQGPDKECGTTRSRFAKCFSRR